MKWILTLTAALGLVLAQPAQPAEAPSEPTHDGKPVSYWVEALEPSRSISTQAKQAEAEEAIHALGVEAIPAILRYRNSNPIQRLTLIRHACAILEPEGDFKIVEALSDSDPTVRETALEVVPKTALPAALDDIVKLLADPVRPVHIAAIQAMVRLAPDREETVSALIEALRDLQPGSTTPPAATAAAAAAATATSATAATAPETTTATLSAESVFSRGDAALSLGSLGAKAKAAVPELTTLLSDSDDSVREAAAIALWKIERNPEVVPVLVDRLENARDYQTCVRVMKILAEMGRSARSAVPVISKKVEDPGVTFVPPNVNFAQLAVDALAKIDPAAAEEARKKLAAP